MINKKAQGETTNASINKYSSAIKGYLDNWYKNNILGTTSESYIDRSAVYCNDRSATTITGWDKDSAMSNPTSIQFNQYTAHNDLNCINTTDRFTAENSNSEAHLTYPVGLLTEPERGLMTASYAKTGQWYWGSSTGCFTIYSGYHFAYVRRVGTSGNADSNYVHASGGVRPVVTLSADASISEGTGTYADPFVVGPKVNRNNTLYNY